MARHFYAMKRSIKNGAPQTPANYPYDTKDEALRQFHLLCASALAPTVDTDADAIEWGTIEKGMEEREYFNHPQPEPEPEPQPEAE